MRRSATNRSKVFASFSKKKAFFHYFLCFQKQESLLFEKRSKNFYQLLPTETTLVRGIT